MGKAGGLAARTGRAPAPAEAWAGKKGGILATEPEDMWEMNVNRFLCCRNLVHFEYASWISRSGI